MARLLPLTEARELEVMRDLGRLIRAIGGAQIGNRLFDLFSEHRKAFEALCCRDSMYCGAIRGMSAQNVLAQYLPVVNDSILGFNAQCDGLPLRAQRLFFDDEIGCDSNRNHRFVVRKLPYVAKRFEKRMRLMRMVEQVIAANATIWDVLAVLHFCRKKLPKKCAICILHSPIRCKHDLRDSESRFVYYYPVAFLNGAAMQLQNVSEDDYVGAPTLFLNYVDSTLDLLA